MPEGDTIHRLAQRINERLAGQRCLGCVTRDPRLVGLDLREAVLVEAVAVGKHLFVRFDDGRSLHVHLGMDGRVIVGPRSSAPEWRRRIELRFAAGWLTGEDLPEVGVVATAGEAQFVGHLGPDVLGDTAIDVLDAAARLRREPDRPLAGALLDQRHLAGFGNVFAVEVPFIAGVSPFQPVGSIGGLDGLVGVGVALIRYSAGDGRRNTTGRRLSAADHWVYGRAGRPCQVCDTPITGADERSTPWGRVTAWCPACQPLGPSAAVDLQRVRRLLALHPARRLAPFPLAAPDSSERGAH
jgi:endonuclease-8